jgi:glycosyltransferase involved in cell wall biosynthesis
MSPMPTSPADRLPLVSVLMPVYNAERYVGEAVKSVLAQTFVDFEFLIVDDGSTDGSLAILRGFEAADPRIRLVSRPNTGYVVALNEMLGRARGEFLARMDADDVALPDRFALQAAYLDQHPRVGCVGCAYELIDGKGRMLAREIELTRNEEIQQAQLQGFATICHPCAMMRREAVLAHGGYDPAMEPAEDLDLWLRMGESWQMANLEQVLMKYRVHGSSVSQVNQAKQLDCMREACARAWKRRGIEGRFGLEGHWRPGPSRQERHSFTVRYGWMAFQHHQRRTAAVYGLKAIRMNPLHEGSWRLLACSLLKQHREEP